MTYEVQRSAADTKRIVRVVAPSVAGLRHI